MLETGELLSADKGGSEDTGRAEVMGFQERERVKWPQARDCRQPLDVWKWEKGQVTEFPHELLEGKQPLPSFCFVSSVETVRNGKGLQGELKRKHRPSGTVLRCCPVQVSLKCQFPTDLSAFLL